MLVETVHAQVQLMVCKPRAGLQSRSANRRKVGRTATYWNNDRKPRPAVITALSPDGSVALRTGRSGITVTGVFPRVNRSDTNVWSA